MTSSARSRDDRWLTPTRLLTLVAVLLATYWALVIVRALRGVLVMLLVSLFLSFAMEPAVQFLSRKGMRRGLATGAVFVFAILLVAAIVVAMIPLVVQQVSELVESVPSSVEDLNRLIQALPFVPGIEVTTELRSELEQLGGDLGERLRTGAMGAAGDVVSLGATALGAIFQLLAIGLITFYLVADGPRLRRALARPLPPERQREMLAIWELAVAKTGGYIYSRILLAAASALAHFVVLLVLDVPFSLPLALFVGVTSAFVPVVGTYLGGVLALLVALVNDPIDALWLAIFIAIYQQIENYVLAPAVQSRTMDVHPAVAFVSVLVGGTLLGAPGALLALPATAIIQAVLSTYVRRHELIAELDEVALPGDPVGPGADRAQTQEAPT
ncbi:MAG: AI-2E family transporter [Nitriliruptorales bacterium]|nr:AI-2E family transporter [Nitriliruptorales bacterium]